MRQHHLKVKHLSILNQGDVLLLWPQIRRIVQAAAKSNTVSTYDLKCAAVREAILNGELAVYAFVDSSDKVHLAFGYRMVETGGQRGVELVFMGGKNLLKTVREFWPSIKEEFRYNGAKFVECYSNERLARIYKKLIGVDRQCVYMQGDL